MAARAELSGVPPSLLPSLLPGLRSPRGRGLSRPYPCRGAGSGPGGAGKALAVPLSCGSCGARSRWVGPGAQTHTRRGAASELGGLLGRCEGRERRVTSAQHHPAALESAPGEREVTCRALPASVGCCPAGPGSSSWDREICYRGQAAKSGLWGLWHSVGHPAFVWDVQLAHCCTVQSGVGRRDASPYKKISYFLSREKWIDRGHSKFFVDDSVLCAACGVSTSIVSSGMAGTCGHAGVVMLGEGERPVLP